MLGYKANLEHLRRSGCESDQRRYRAGPVRASEILDAPSSPAPTTSMWWRLSQRLQSYRTGLVDRSCRRNENQRTHYKVPTSQAISSLESPLRSEFLISDALTLGRSDPVAWNRDRSESLVPGIQSINLQYHGTLNSKVR